MLRDLVIATMLVALASSAAPAEPSGSPGPPKAVEGMVKRVDHVEGTVKVSTGRLGLFGHTLEITGDTEIQVGTRRGGVGDIREGATVKAAYETQDGKDIATRIEVIPSAPTK